MSTEELELKCKEIRRDTLDYVVQSGKGHLGGSFSCVEILVALYYGGILKHDPKNPEWPERDRFILSKGHSCNTLYTILADLGYFPKSELDRYTQNGALLGGHSDWRIPGVEVISGSLGHGLGIASGLAWAAQMKGEKHRVFCLLGDGECMEGSVWEAIMFASHRMLSNLTVIVDCNGLFSEDSRHNICEPIMKMQSLASQYGWEVQTYNGNKLSYINFFQSQKYIGKPMLILSRTEKGLGLPYAGTPRSHHTIPTEMELQGARRILN